MVGGGVLCGIGVMCFVVVFNFVVYYVFVFLLVLVVLILGDFGFVGLWWGLCFGLVVVVCVLVWWICCKVLFELIGVGIDLDVC